MIFAVPFGLAIGLVIAAVGGGGAILALPVLVYALGQPPGPASTASLIVVTIAASVGAGVSARERHVCWRVALALSLPASLASLPGAALNHAVGGRALVLAFIPVMLLAARSTWRRACATDRDEAGGACPSAPVLRMAPAGAAAGLMTGFFGVGGGFVIVPLLTAWLGMSFRRAVPTSLVVIAVTGLAALLNHLAAGTGIADPPLTIALAAATATGAILGTKARGRLPSADIGRAFALVVASIAMLLLIDVILLGGPPGGG